MQLPEVILIPVNFLLRKFVKNISTFDLNVFNSFIEIKYFILFPFALNLFPFLSSDNLVHK